MKKVLLVATALLAATPALAADLGRRPAPYYGPEFARSLFNWTGFYVGGNAGWGWGSALGTDPSGYLIGLQAGYNFQYASGVLAGVETDIAITGAEYHRASRISVRGSGQGDLCDGGRPGTRRNRYEHCARRNELQVLRRPISSLQFA
jgi:opacity protein-like surface antigen